MDELETRVRSLDAERSRPDAKPETTEELLYRLIAAIHNAYCTPADEKREAS
jgi:hypothetical protein